MSTILKKVSRLPAVLVIVLFSVNTVLAPVSYAQLAFLPEAGTMVQMTPKFDPMVVKGVKFYPDNPFKFDFIVDTGDARLNQNEIKVQGQKLASYFLASLTTPEKEMWVNLSPYEKNRIIPPTFGETQMGSELLSEDYILKQIMATALYPERQLGQEFWANVYSQAQHEFGTTNVSINTFNKVWIVPNKAVVYQNAQTNSVFVVESSLKVMLEQDYLAANKHKAMEQYGMLQDALQKSVSPDAISSMSSKIIKQIVIPALEREVNEGKNFSSLRQVYQSLILAAWYKKNLKDTILAKGYVDRGKTLGVDTQDKQINNKIYQQYLRAYKKGAYNYIKEDVDPATNTVIPRKYFSGGFTDLGLTDDLAMATEIQKVQFDSAMAGNAFNRRLVNLGIGLFLAAGISIGAAHPAGAAQAGLATQHNSIASALSLPADSQTHQIEKYAINSPLPDEIVVHNLTGNVEQAAVNAINTGSIRGSVQEVDIKSGKSVIKAIEAAGAITIEEEGKVTQISPNNANDHFQTYTLHIQVRGLAAPYATLPAVATTTPQVAPTAAAVPALTVQAASSPAPQAAVQSIANNGIQFINVSTGAQSTFGELKTHTFVEFTSSGELNWVSHLSSVGPVGHYVHQGGQITNTVLDFTPRAFGRLSKPQLDWIAATFKVVSTGVVIASGSGGPPYRNNGEVSVFGLGKMPIGAIAAAALQHPFSAIVAQNGQNGPIVVVPTSTATQLFFNTNDPNAFKKYELVMDNSPKIAGAGTRDHPVVFVPSGKLNDIDAIFVGFNDSGNRGDHKGDINSRGDTAGGEFPFDSQVKIINGNTGNVPRAAWNFITGIGSAFSWIYPDTGSTPSELGEYFKRRSVPIVTDLTAEQIKKPLIDHGIDPKDLRVTQTINQGGGQESGGNIVTVTVPEGQSAGFASLGIIGDDARYKLSQWLINDPHGLDYLMAITVHSDYFAQWTAAHPSTIEKSAAAFHSDNPTLNRFVDLLSKRAILLSGPDSPNDIIGLLKADGITGHVDFQSTSTYRSGGIENVTEVRYPVDYNKSAEGVILILDPKAASEIFERVKVNPNDPLLSIMAPDENYTPPSQVREITAPPPELSPELITAKSQKEFREPMETGGNRAMITNEPPFGGIDLEKVVVESRGSGIKSAFNDPHILQMVLDAGGLMPQVKSVETVTVPMVNLLLGFNNEGPTRQADSKSVYLKTAFIDILKKMSVNS